MTTIPLPALDASGTTGLARVLRERRSVRAYAPEPLRTTDVARLLWSAQGVVDPDGRRTTPSARSLYPLTVDALVRRVEGVAPGVHRYRPHDHALQHRSDGDPRGALQEAAFGEQPWLDEAPVVFALLCTAGATADAFQDQSEPERRARRYAELEAGAAAQNLQLQATALGLGAVLVGGIDEARAAEALGAEADARVLALVAVGRPVRGADEPGMSG